MTSPSREPPRHEIRVLPVPSPDGERFIILDSNAFAADFTRAFLSTSTTPERLAAIAEHLHGYPVLDTMQVRGRLNELGLSEAAADEQLARARRIATAMAGTMALGGAVSFERITRPGFTNDDGQQVLRRTERTGPGGQRVFVMQCGVCGHEYGSYGCDADIRRCPKCQDGPPGVLMT